MSSIVLHQIEKRFSHKRALKGVDIVLSRHQIHALLGENGAGKSTLASIISGKLSPTSGTINIEGKNCIFNSPADARKHGIVMVAQRPLVSSVLIVWQNIILGADNPILGIVNRKQSIKRIQEIVEKWNIRISLLERGKNLTASGRFYTSLLAALLFKPTYLILDEPSAALDTDEREQLYKKLNNAASSGMGILVITHSMTEAALYCDKITILKKGELIAQLDNTKRNISEKQLSDFMFPSDNTDKEYDGESKVLQTQKIDKPTSIKEIVLGTEDLTAKPLAGTAVFNITFDIRKGEFVYITGQRESGIETLERILSGLNPVPFTGQIIFAGKRQEKLTIKQLRAFGVGIIPFDRTFTASNPELSVLDILTSNCNSIYRTEFAQKLIKEQQINICLDEKARNLSGGMLQRLILAREISSNPKLLILSEPLQGLDFDAAKKSILLFKKLAKSGIAILVLSSMEKELVEAADKIYTLDGGVLTRRKTSWFS